MLPILQRTHYFLLGSALVWLSCQAGSAQTSAPKAPEVQSGEAQPIPRRLLVLFGHDGKEAGRKVLWPQDTITALHLQTTLEWLGYEVEYWPMTKGLPKGQLDARFAGVIFDGTLRIPYPSEMECAQWLGSVVEQGRRVLILGDYPLNQDAPRRRMARVLGLRGNGYGVLQPKDLKITRADPVVMAGEVPVKANPFGFTNFSAPSNGKPFLTLSCIGETGQPAEFDALFAAPWGGAILDPYFYKQFSINDLRQLLDPFAFLSQALPVGFPAPDPNTREGLRVLYSHIDGDGFNAISTVEPNKINAEIVRDHVLKRFAMPITVSIVEANLRGLDVDSDAKQTPFFEKIAREIYALPNVQAASHSFSHPFIWMASDVDPNPLNHTARNLTMRPEANYPEINYEREITGSIDYINKNLLPPGKKVELMLWSGNCRPGPEALALTRRIGVENMNGGNTIQSKRWPGRTGVAPRTMMMGDELQILAANQNEMYYTDEWRSSFLGGFQAVRETFAMTGAPLRLKPVNIYYHFYSAERGDALNALLLAYKWAFDHPLHSVTALQYAQAVRDSRDAVIIPAGPRRWLLRSQGHIRTWRLPVTAGFPVVGLDRGITGWNDFGAQRYFHTTGQREVTLELTDAPPASPALLSSSGQTTFTALTDREMAFSVKDYRPCKLEIHLPGSAAQWSILLNGQPAAAQPVEGKLVLNTEMEATVVIKRS